MRKKELSVMFEPKGAVLREESLWKATLEVLQMWAHLYLEEFFKQTSQAEGLV